MSTLTQNDLDKLNRGCSPGSANRELYDLSSTFLHQRNQLAKALRKLVNAVNNSPMQTITDEESEALGDARTLLVKLKL